MALSIRFSFAANTATEMHIRCLVRQLFAFSLTQPLSGHSEIVELTGNECELPNDIGANTFLLASAQQLVERGGTLHRTSPNHIVAFTVYPAHGCEQVHFGLARATTQILSLDPFNGLRCQWYWQGFCKTSTAGHASCGGIKNFLKSHLLIISILEFAKTLGIHVSVEDDTKFWLHRDIEDLAMQLANDKKHVSAILFELSRENALKWPSNSQPPR
jgi:hypothetical protein